MFQIRLKTIKTLLYFLVRTSISKMLDTTFGQLTTLFNFAITNMGKKRI